MTRPVAVPSRRLHREDFVPAIEPDDLLYFVLNVGDADCQLLVLPASDGAPREAIVVDVGRAGKLPPLVDALDGLGLLGPLRVVVATHPHLDHIGGMPDLLDRYADRVAEYWDSGFRHPTPVYFDVLRTLEDRRATITYVQPTSGMTRYFDRVRVTVLAPAISLRNRYDSYGVDPNNASVCLKVEYPVTRTVEESDRRYLEARERDDDGSTRLVLGADAQMLSWGTVMADFPDLDPDNSPVLRALRMAGGVSPLRAEVLKVPHHCSKNGVTVELASTVRPALSIVSSLAVGSSYGFPHALAQGALREARLPIAQRGLDRWPEADHDLGIHYTGAVDTGGRPLGSMCLVVKSTSSRIHLWRFRDAPDDGVDLSTAYRFLP